MSGEGRGIERDGHQSAIKELNFTANLLGTQAASSSVPSLNLSFRFQIDHLSFKTLPLAGGEEFLPQVYQSHPSLSLSQHFSQEKNLKMQTSCQFFKQK